LFLFLPVFAFAVDTVLVPCSGIDCTFCSFFDLFQNIFNFAITTLAPAVAVFGVAYGGYFILIGGANPSNVSKGKDALKNTAIGFVIVYAAYAIASTLVWFLAEGVIGGSGVNFGFSGGTFNFECSSDPIGDATADFMKDGVVTLQLEEPEPTIRTGSLWEDRIGSGAYEGYVKKGDVSVNVMDLNPNVQQALSNASSDANLNGIELVVTSGLRSLEGQRTLATHNCPIGTSSSKECSPPTCIPDMTQSPPGSNCRHTTGNAVDVWGRRDGVQCGRTSSCQQAVISIMKRDGFCVLYSEPWHFELQSSLFGSNRITAFSCP